MVDCRGQPVGDAAGAPGIRLLQSLDETVRWREHVALVRAAEFLLDQTPLRLLMILEHAATADMRDRYAVVLELMTHQDAAVAGQRILLRAHQGDAIARSASQQALDPGGEDWQLGNLVVASLAVNITFRFVSSRAELPAQKHITHVRRLQTCLQELAREMRKARAVRL